MLPFAEEKLDGSDSKSEEDFEPWDQPVDVDAQPAPDAEPESEFVVDRPMLGATIQRQEQSAEGPVLDSVGYQLTRKGPVSSRDRVLPEMGIL